MSNRERIQKALDSLLYLPHLKAQHDEPSLPVAAAPAAGGGGGGGGDSSREAGRGRPWDRGDLFRRLATFKSSTWFCKPDVISPVECARRGWTNTAADLLTCEFCKAKVSCPISPELLPEQAVEAGQRYAARLSEAHDAACPWRTATSSLSLLQFPPLTQEAVRRDFGARCAALQRLVCLPPVAAEPYGTLAAAASKQRLDQLLLHGTAGQQQQQPFAANGAASAAATSAAATAAALAEAAAEADASGAVGEGVAVVGTPAFEARARLLALCGWSLKLMTTAAAPGSSSGSQQQQPEEDLLPSHVGPESAALLCSLCNAKAGLWSCFPQCKPVVLQAPWRSIAAASAAAQPPSAAVHRSTVSRNVAADISTTIAGGVLEGAAAGAAAAPFGAGAQQPAAFGIPSLPASSRGEQGGSTAAAAADRSAGAAAADTSAQPQQQPAASFGSAATGGPACMPVFGFAALQASRPAPPLAGQAVTSAEAAAAAAAASAKRKQPDFRWETVLADIDAKAAAEKRSRAAAAGAAAAAAAGTAAAAAAPLQAARRGQPALSQQQKAAAAAMAASKYKAVQATPVDPLALHRPFCPWVNCSQAGEKEGRCGWRWCLQQLAAPAAATAAAATAAATAAAADDSDGGGTSSGKELNPAKLLRSVLHQLDVHK